MFKTGSWLQGRLVLLDLAYFKYRRFAVIDENNGYFVSRLKESVNPVITEELREWRGRAILLEGDQIPDVVDDLHRTYIDVEVEAEFKRGPYGGHVQEIRSDSVSSVSSLRMLTTTTCTSRICREEFLLADLVTLCRCRWEGEVLFRELKTHYELDEFDTSNPDVVILFGTFQMDPDPPVEKSIESADGR